MNPARTITVLLIAAIALVFSGCQKKTAETPDFGKTENSVYRNEFFGMTMTIPKGWSTPDDAGRRKVFDEHVKKTGNEENRIVADNIQTFNMLMAFKYPKGEPILVNPNIVILAESVLDSPEITRGKDYLLLMKNYLPTDRLPMSISDEITTEAFGGKPFDLLEVKIAGPNLVMKQNFYSTIFKGYALNVTVTYVSEQDEATLNEILQSITFN